VAEISRAKGAHEINGVPEQPAREAFLLASAKLPLKTIFVARQTAPDPKHRRIEMKVSELRGKDAAGPRGNRRPLKAHFGLRMQKATQQISNTAGLRQTRRDIARAKTVLAEKKKGAAK
jgi:large subunit ribosomal protein L29